VSALSSKKKYAKALKWHEKVHAKRRDRAMEAYFIDLEKRATVQ
jgi:hypothetical protein